MYAILIVNNIGDVREWDRGTHKHCRDLAKLLPKHGWRLHSIVKL